MTIQTECQNCGFTWDGKCPVCSPTIEEQKLSPEQREEIQRDLDHIKWWDQNLTLIAFNAAEYAEHYAAQNRLKKSIPLLVASEQAWREEVERTKGATAAVFENREKWRDAHELMTIQFNQAVEVLKWYGDIRNHCRDIDSFKVLPSNVMKDEGERAQDFLSSLSQGSEEKG